MSHLNRVVILIDMDCFYCQVEEKLNPKLAGEPIAVVQYNAWRGGGIIAVNYPARDKGVTRHMRGHDAREKCPNIKLVRVPQVRGKADLTKYRNAGKDVADVLQTFTTLLERASVDEAYLDITDLVNNKIAEGLEDLTCDNMKNTFVVGTSTESFLDAVKTNIEFSESDLKLAVGGLIAEDIRRAVYDQTGYRCSAGIAHNKILAKLVCGLNKPNKQTILPHASIAEFFETTPISKIKSLGGKFGKSLAEDLGITYMGQLAQISKKELMKKFDAKNAVWLYDIARGIDMEPVTTKLISKSIGCCKKFPGRAALTTSEKVEHWLSELCCEMHERLDKDLEENNRKAKQMVVSFVQDVNGSEVHSSKTHPIHSYDKQKIFYGAYDILKKMCMRSDGSYTIKYLGLSAGHFEENKNIRDIASFFKLSEQGSNKKTFGFSCSRTNDLSNCTDVGGSKLAEEKKSIDNCENSADSKDDDSGCHDSDSSTSTQDLHENSNDLFFYDDKNLTNESKSPKNVTPKILKNSFFNNYFYRNEPSVESSEAAPKTHAEPAAGTEICEECSESVPLADLVSHSDHHFAMRLTESESGSSNSVDRIRPNVPEPARAKRKRGETISLLQYFRTDSEATETCSECNRKLRIDELETHGDYHLAKKLHLELNSDSVTKPSAKQKTKIENFSN